MAELLAGDTRVFLFHSADASADPGGAMEKVNAWLSKDRAGSPYANLRVQDITITADGSGGVYTTIVCSLGRATAAPTPPAASPAASPASSSGDMGGTSQDPSAAI